MNTNITTLALNLLISERVNHRIIFGNKIIEILQQNIEDIENEKENKDIFLKSIKNCIKNPNCESRISFFEHAKYFNQKINGDIRLSSVA
jgi:hypothetical protein